MRLILLATGIFFFIQVTGQGRYRDVLIKEMKWSMDYQIYLTLSNDSAFVLNLEDLHHSELREAGENINDLVYFPVSLDEQFLNILKEKETETVIIPPDINKTLWSAIHHSLGGGWIHFVNCLVYALETGQLDLTAPLLKRPETRWKPRPMTESFKRTRKWGYYVPVNQRLALKEHKLRKKEGQLDDLTGVPDEFLNLFLSTSNRQYKRYMENKQAGILAKIDMVKLLLGARYLGETQIVYIRTMVLKAAMHYSAYHLPSVIFLNDFNAAVAMSLDETGYKIERILFHDDHTLAQQDKNERVTQIENLVKGINQNNKRFFEQRLQHYYKR